ncbi:MAG: hypothetical protein K2K26_00215 [Muribaculaceae bacterium]|nr:hypothetical protein [Muribaculaceae bacterium]
MIPKNLIKLTRSLSLKNTGNLITTAISLGNYIPVILSANAAIRNMHSKPDLAWNSEDNPPFDNPEEKMELLNRVEWLCKQVIGDPQSLIDKMPQAIGREYQGQWAYYAVSMTVAALSNISYIYPEYRKLNLSRMSELIDMAMTPTIKLYDTMKWKEDPIDSLGGNKSHMTYLSILAWMIGHYKLTGGDERYDTLYHSLCKTLYRRMLKREDMNLPSFPNGIVFLPDMMFTPLALKIYSDLYNGEYIEVVRKWSELTRVNWIDSRTGLLISRYYKSGQRKAPCGSYAALNCSCLVSFAEDFGTEQYIRTKEVFGRVDSTGKYGAILEYLNKSPRIAFNVDVGIIINGMSPTGTSFILGAATYLGDWKFRRQLLNTADKAGGTVNKKGECHYRLAEVMLTGEAITLAMRTNVKRKY